MNGLPTPARTRASLCRSPQALGVIVVLALTAAACGTAGGAGSPSPAAPSPAPTVRPTPTPIAATVASPEDAAALVIATDPRFAGAIQLTPDLIGASKWWIAKPLAEGGYQIELTVGSGDCQAGCIEKHTWTFEVDPEGRIQLVTETDD